MRIAIELINALGWPVATVAVALIIKKPLFDLLELWLTRRK